MRRVRVLAIALAVLLSAGGLSPALASLTGSSSPTTAGAELTHPGLTRLAAAVGTTPDVVEGVATFGGRRPTAAQLDALRRLGLTVQGFERLPLALLRGPYATLVQAVTGGLAADVYPNDRLVTSSTESTEAIRSDELRAAGVTGEGVGVAIVDTGVDATHPALADHVTHNVKIVGPEYVNGLGPRDPYLALPVDQGPYNNTDTSGHGTHVAGIVAGDGTGDENLVGVAPDAEIIGYGTGDAVFVFTTLASFDHILTHKDEWNIDVVNNSWGSNYRMFDPNEPIQQASKALHDAGLTVAFSAGNDGIEMSLNPYSAAPWVISVGSGTVSGQRSDFSSGGIEFDNSLPVPIPEEDDHHVRFEGDRIGVYHPDVTGPGTAIVSTGTPTGVGVAAPAAPGGSATLSGTSMSSPHIAGVAALLESVRPDLTPDQIREVMQVTAVPLADGATFSQSGYGYVDAKAAVDFVRRSNFRPALLKRRQAAADFRVKAARSWSVLSTDFWSFTAAPATVGGLPDSRVYEVEVGPDTQGVKALVSYPSLNYVGLNFFDYELALKDPDGEVVATSTPSEVAGQSVLSVDFRQTEAVEQPGRWTLEVTGLLGAQDNDTLMGRLVTLTLAQLEPQKPRAWALPPEFQAAGTLELPFRGGEAGATTSPEGCDMQAGAPKGGMGAGEPGEPCKGGTVGYAQNYGAGDPASFVSEPLAAPVTVGGTATLVAYLADGLQPAWSNAFASGVAYELAAVDAAGKRTVLAAGDAAQTAQAGPTATRGAYELAVPAATVPAGSSLQLDLNFSGFYTSTMRFLWDGDFADAGLTLTTGTLG